MTTEQARFIVYMLGAAAGAAVVVIGAVRGDMALVAAGGALIGTDLLAAKHVTR